MSGGGAVNAGEVRGRLSLDDDFTMKMTQAQKGLQSFSTQWDKASRKLAESAGALLPASLAVTALGVGALRASAQFETAMTKIITIAGESKSELGAMKKAVLDLAPAVGVGPQALADALLVVESTGIRGATALDILKRSAMASSTGLGEAKDIADRKSVV